MKVTINFLPEFFRQAKLLRKRYASFERDYQLLLDDLILIYKPFLDRKTEEYNIYSRMF